MSSKLAAFICFVLSQSTMASTFDPGPPPLNQNFAIADDIFAGEVVSIAPGSRNDRGDSRATLLVKGVWKGGLVSGELIEISFNRSCSFLVREMDCVRHTLNLRPGIRYAFFTRGQRKRFAAKAFGTQEFSKVEFELGGVSKGMDVNWLLAARRKLHLNEHDLFIASIVNNVPAEHKVRPTQITGFDVGQVYLRVEKPISSERRIGEIIPFNFFYSGEKFSYGFDRGYFEKLKGQILVSPITDNAPIAPGLEPGSFMPLFEVEKEATSIQAEMDIAFKKLGEQRGLAGDDVGRIGPSRNIFSLLGSFFYLISDADFLFGFKWNPDIDAVAN